MKKTLGAADTIAAARRNRRPLQPLAGDKAPQNESDGYRIQHAVHGLLSDDFGTLAGYRIGCTSPVMQQYLGIPNPCGGGVVAGGVHKSGVTLRSKDFVRVGVECESSVQLARDFEPSEAPSAAADVTGVTPPGAPV